MGRFFQLDPSRQEMNPYLYATANPIMNTDPSGLICVNGRNVWPQDVLPCGWINEYAPGYSSFQAYYEQRSLDTGWPSWLVLIFDLACIADTELNREDSPEEVIVLATAAGWRLSPEPAVVPLILGSVAVTGSMLAILHVATNFYRANYNVGSATSQPNVDTPELPAPQRKSYSESDLEQIREAYTDAVREAQADPSRMVPPPPVIDGGQVEVFRGVDARNGSPRLSPSQFIVQGDGLSTFELPNLPGNKPFMVGFSIHYIETYGGITLGTVQGLPQCVGIRTYILSPGHWSLICLGESPNQMQQTFSDYSKMYRNTVVHPNPNWTGN